VGDLNIQLDKMDRKTSGFKDLLNSLDLLQHVSEPTHDRGHTLDVVITRSGDQGLIESLTIYPFAFSDHHLITYKLPWTKPTSVKKKVTFRNTRSIDIEEFMDKINYSSLVTNPPTDLNAIVNDYNSTLSAILDDLAPQQTKEIVLRPHAPWYNPKIRRAKQHRRQAERRWRKSKLSIHKQIFKECQKEVSRLCDEAKTNHLNSKISENEKDGKYLFRLTNNLIGKKNDHVLPSYIDEKDMTDKFISFFDNKIATIRQNFTNSSTTANAPPKINAHTFSNFTEISQEDLEKLIATGNSKSCILDPIPTTLLKQVLPSLLPILHTIVNKSLQSGQMPSQLKAAIVKPILKKSTDDSENMKSYRPVSNLPYISKVIEKVAVNQLDTFLSDHDLNEPLQSAYRTNHSTETALVKVSNDILLALDKRECVYLVLLDLSAAFDTIDHDVFLSRLQNDCAVVGDALQWMKSYLSDRHQCVTINSTSSENVPLRFGFPQGSTIGPFGFKIYTKALTSIAKKYNINIHLYADDTQLYTSFDPKNSKSAKENLEGCIDEIRHWMELNYLKLNDSKTEFLILGSNTDLDRVSEKVLKIGTSEIQNSKSARNIGVFMDETLNLKTHISNTIKSCHAQIHKISRIRKYLTTDASKTIVHALITSRLDNLNSLLHKLPDCELDRLQKTQNTAARLIYKQPRENDITPTLKTLHWLPVTKRIEYKILLLTFKCLHDIAPSYLSSLLQQYVPPRPLRSSSCFLLREHPTVKKYGDRAFFNCAPALWNKLPRNIKQCKSVKTFKNRLKTHLYEEAYDND